MRSKIIAVDFDGTIVDHAYPDIGRDNPLAIETLKQLQENNRLILLTMRNGEALRQAVEYCADKGVRFWAINENPEMPMGEYWSQKVHANVYIDDNGLGCPMATYAGFNRKCVDWYTVRQQLEGGWM